MRALLLALILCSDVLCSAAETSSSALDALKLLPEEDQESVARIEGPDGSPNPERWYVLVHSKASDNGVKEFVIANGELVATRQVSQFADSLAADDVVGHQKIRVDSDRLAKLAADYAEANEITYSTLSYRLGKAASETLPVWSVTCNDESGQVIATLVATADKAEVLSHEGFAVEPSKAGRKKTKQRKVKFQTQASAEVAVDHAIRDGVRPAATDLASAEEAEPDPADSSAEDESARSSGRSSARSEQGGRSRRVYSPSPGRAVRDVTRPVRRALGRILPF